jgi:hypothetical protein
MPLIWPELKGSVAKVKLVVPARVDWANRNVAAMAVKNIRLMIGRQMDFIRLRG